MSTENAAKTRTRRRHLPTGTVEETHERPTNAAPVDDREYASTTVWTFNGDKFEAVRR